MVMRDFGIPLKNRNRENSKGIGLNNSIHNSELMDTYRTLHLQNTFFSSSNAAFIKTDIYWSRKLISSDQRRQKAHLHGAGTVPFFNCSVTVQVFALLINSFFGGGGRKGVHFFVCVYYIFFAHFLCMCIIFQNLRRVKIL